MFTKKAQTGPDYVCEKCDYICSRLSHWNRHIATAKHHKSGEMFTNSGKMFTNMPNLITKIGHICACGKEYKHRQSLYYIYTKKLVLMCQLRPKMSLNLALI